MKMKFVRNGRTGRRELLVAAQRGETLATKEADHLAANLSPLLLSFAYEKQRGGTTLLHYDVEGLWSLRTYLSKRAMSLDELMGLLEALQAVLDLCAERCLHVEGLLFDPEYLFVDAQCCPHFVLTPLNDVPFQTRNSPLTLLAVMGDTSRLRFASPDAEGLSRRLGDLVVDLEGVFSVNRFRRFLADEQHQGGMSLPALDDEEPGTGSVWVTAGGGATSSDADLNRPLFWSPLEGIAALEPEHDADVSPQTPATKVPLGQSAGISQVAPVEPVPAAPTAPQPAPQAEAPMPVAEPPAVASQPLPAAWREPDTAQRAPQPEPSPQPAPAPAPVVQAAPTPRPVPVPTPAPAPAPQTVLWLVRPATGERYALPTGQQVKVGRGSACDIRILGNRKLSRMHAALTSTGQMLMVSDLGAANGVFVDGRRIGQMQSALIAVGQSLRLADEELVLQMG